ncbi:MAG: type IX secretion system sortase PorU [Prevotellaceae bacterium]|jgi:hypothetical protein|nr:type IX secretion system sortase PorU [Prevotellaceae bacterium]
MKKNLFLLCMLCASISWAQGSLQRSLSWIDADTSAAARSVRYSYPFFYGCSYDVEKRQAVYFEAIRSSQPFVLETSGTQPLPSSEEAKLANVNVGNDFIFQCNTSTDKGQAVQRVSLYPIRKNPTTGRLERITGFTLKSSAAPQKLTTRVSTRATAPATNSVLSGGAWVKLEIRETGVYAISSSMLKQWGLSNDVNRISVWGNGCGILSRHNSDHDPDDLQTIPTLVDNGQLLFYAEATNQWKYNVSSDFFSHILNEFSPNAYVYITDGLTQRSIQTEAAAGTATHNASTYTYRAFHERVDTNLLKSGRRFFGEMFGANTQLNLSFSVPNADFSQPLKLQICAAASSNMVSSYSVSVNGGAANTLSIPALAGGWTAMVDTALFTNISYNSSSISARITFNKPSVAASGTLDFVAINANANLVLANDQLPFRNSATVGTGNVTTFNISTQKSDVMVWDVTDLHNVKSLQTFTINGAVQVTVATNSLREFIAFTKSRLLKPSFAGKVANQDLHGHVAPDYLIVTHPSFLQQANRLARIHQKHSDLNVLVATTEQVYNEFSSGIPDVSAIRNLVRLKRPEYVLLFGNGSYVNYAARKGCSLVPTYQSDNSLYSDLSYVTDDFFGLLDEHESIGDVGMTGTLNVAVGRFPANNTNDANTLVTKVEQYLGSPAGSWMSRFTFIADDEDSNVHMSQAEELGNYVLDSFPAYSVNKIYFDAYVQQTNSGGERYPDVTEAICSDINNGALFVNYTGHANDQWIAHEQVVTKADIERWSNRNKLPLFVTATCEFSRFDDYNTISAGEMTLLKTNGGAVAMLSTTRLVYSAGNAALNKEFVKQFFRKDNSGQHLRLGEIVRRTKNNSSTGVNQLNFSLLGDPALLMHYPAAEVATTSINGTPISGNIDTLKSLAKIAVGAQVASGAAKDTIEISVFDKASTKRTLGNGGQIPFPYRDQSSLIYRGNITTSNGSMSARFVVPRDIDYRYGNGKISYFGSAGSALAAGSFTTIKVGGAAAGYEVDTTPPSIKMYMNSERFVPGGITNETPTFMATISDSSGINATGNGIGRDITLNVITTGKTYSLNDYYTANTDSYTDGRISFPMPPLPLGSHTVTLKVFDVYNNSAEQSMNFTVAEDDKLTIRHVLNYPNPFTQKTAFFFEHNRPYTGLDVMIQVFTISGKLVKTIRCSITESSTSLRSAPIEWDGRDDYGDRLGKGVYLYKVKVRCKSGETAEKVEKIVLL